MKKIAIIAHGLSGGGAERVAALLANNFSQKGNEVLFVSVYNSEREYKLENTVKYTYINVNEKNKLKRLIRRSKMIDRELKNFMPDMVISFIINEMIITNIKGKVPIVYTLRNDPNATLKSFFDKWICKFSYSRAYKIVFQTPGARDYFSNNIRKKGLVIGNPLTSNLPYWSGKKHKKKIITACRLAPQKNLKMLINGFKEFHKNHKDYILEIYGKGELQEELEKYCMDIKMKEYIKFPGHSKKIHEIMSESSAFALTSDFEGVSNSMLEALAIGVPTICTDCPPGGAALYIKNGVNGMLVPVGDVQTFTNKLSTIIDNEELAIKFSEKSIKIRNELNEQAIVDRWCEVI